MKTIRKFLSVFAIALIGGGTALTFDHYYFQKANSNQFAANNSSAIPIKLASLTTAMPEMNTDFVAAAQKTVPAVVYIQAKVEMERQRSNNPLWDFFNGQAPQGMMEGQVSGSGVIVSADGYIVTNNHVVSEAGEIQVTMSDKKKYTAKVIGKDPETDLALLKIDAKNLIPIEYGNSDDVLVGQWVLAVGNPYNLTSTVTAGIVSAKGRSMDILPREFAERKINPIESFIQTDAAVNPGNSGGALVNNSGQLIGINSAIASNTGSYTGYSFAIPVNLVRKVVGDLLEYGKVQRAFIGVSIKNVDEDMAKTAGLNTINGTYVQSLLPSGAGEAAGIKQGDIIVKIGDQDVADVSSLEENIGGHRPGDKITVTVSRDGKLIELPVTLRNIDGTTAVVTNASNSTEAVSALGASLVPLSDDEKKTLKLEGGAKVEELGEGTFKEIGIKKGFIITKLDRQQVNSPDDIKSILDEKTGGVLVEGIYPNGMRAYYAFGM